MKSKTKKVVKKRTVVAKVASRKGKLLKNKGVKGKSAESLKRRGVKVKNMSNCSVALSIYECETSEFARVELSDNLSKPAVKDLTHLIKGLIDNPKDCKKLIKVLRGIYKDY